MVLATSCGVVVLVASWRLSYGPVVFGRGLGGAGGG